MLVIKNNIMASNAARQLGKSYESLGQSVSRLSSGLRINTAGDDAAGLAVRELIRADVATLQQGARNARDGISMLQAAEGAMGVIDEVLVRMKQLAEQAATETYSADQRGIMDEEFSQLISEIDRIAKNTEFNEIQMLNDETAGDLDVHLGSEEMITIKKGYMTGSGLGVHGEKSTGILDIWSTSKTSTVALSAGDMRFTFGGASAQTSFSATFTNAAHSLEEIVNTINSASRATTEAYDAAELVYEENSGMWSIKVSAKFGSANNNLTSVTDIGDGVTASWTTQDGTGSKVSIATATEAQTALDTVDQAIIDKDEYRASLGYMMNRLEASISVIDIQAENLMAAESRISDVDVAKEMAAMTRNQVLAQAGISMLSQANSMPQMALSLLQ
jgi:flagellin